MTCYFLLPNLSAGGAERVCITFAKLLRRHGIEVVFVDFGNGKGEMKKWIDGEFEVVSLGCSRVMLGISRMTAFIKSHPGGMMFTSREHASIAGIIVSMMTKTPIVVRIPNMPSNVLHHGLAGLKWKLIKLINRRLLGYAKYIIGQTEAMRDELISYYRLNPQKVVAVNNPVDKEFVLASAQGAPNPYEPGHVNFLTVCNVAYSKGVDILLEIDTQGALSVMEKCPEGLFIFLVPPSLAELERRIRGRGSETEESLQKRMGSARKEIEDGKKYGYVVVNDTVKNAVQRIMAIRTAEHCRMDKNQEIFEELAK